MEARVQHRCQQGHTFSQVSRTGSLLVSPSLQAPASPWLMVASPPPPPRFYMAFPIMCAAVSTSLLIRTVVGVGPILNPGGFYFKTLICIFQDPFPNTKCQADMILGGVTLQSTPASSTASNQAPDLPTQNLFC